MYALNLDTDGRILSATYAQYAKEGAVLVDTLPAGDIYDNRYVDGAYIYDPLPNVRVVGFDSVPGGFAGLFDNDGYLF